MEKIATDTYSFERIRNGGFVYVDKTAILKTLADGSIGTQFFVARPRRFGKSLAISTLQCLFEGRRELFQGLAIEPDWDWSKTYPVLKLDMGSCQAASVGELWTKIGTMLESESRRLKMPVHGEDASAKLRFMIEDLAALNPEGKMVLQIGENRYLRKLGNSRDERETLISFARLDDGIELFKRIADIIDIAFAEMGKKRLVVLVDQKNHLPFGIRSGKILDHETQFRRSIVAMHRHL